jgi:ATP-dependent Clp protease ATP-binding subunit ClpC
MFERFTDRARRVVVLAQEEARGLNHNYIGTEHLLLGLVREGDSVGVKVLGSLGISAADVQKDVKEIVGRGKENLATEQHMPFTPPAKKVLELALRECHAMGHDYIGTEHILLGLIREGNGTAADVLVVLGADLDSAREAVTKVLSERVGDRAAGLTPKDALSPAALTLESLEPTCPSCLQPLNPISAKTLRVAHREYEEVVLVYCTRCGAALGVLPSKE